MKAPEKNILILLLILAPFIGHTQSKWTIGMNSSPSFTKMNGQSSSSNYLPTYNLGLKSMYSINEQLFLNFGFMYRQKKGVLSFPYTQNLIDENGNINPDNVTSYNTLFHYNFVSAPVSINYMIPKKNDGKLSLFVSTGIDLNYLNSVKTIADLPDGDQTNIVRPDEFKNKIGSSVTIGAGLLYELTPRFILSATPEYSYDFYFGNETEPKFHSLGLNLEFHYRFQ